MLKFSKPGGYGFFVQKHGDYSLNKEILKSQYICVYMCNIREIRKIREAGRCFP